MAEEEDVMRPSDVDSLPSTSGEPEGWHVREKTEDGYPLMGSSPAEREEAMWRSLWVRTFAMRDHVFEGDGQYCAARISMTPMGSAETGTIRGWVGCGYPHDAHPIPEPERVRDATMTRVCRQLRQTMIDDCWFSPEDWRKILRDTYPSSLSRVGRTWIERYGREVDWTATPLWQEAMAYEREREIRWWARRHYLVPPAAIRAEVEARRGSVPPAYVAQATYLMRGL